MLKHLTYGLMAAAAMSLGLTSCSSDDPAMLPDADGNVSFTVEMPASMATRAFGEGQNATTLTAYAYLHGSTTVLATETNTFSNLKSTVTFNLANGRDYDFVFVATDPNGSAVTYSTTDQQISVNYTNVNINDESLDCFYNTVQNFHVSRPITETVKLYRPFAQVNIGTLATDLAAATNATQLGSYIADLKTSLTTTTYSKLNVMDGSVADQAEVTFGAAAAPTNEAFPYQPTTYSYLSMDYLLVPADASLVNCTFKVYSGTTEINSVPMDNIPVQRNYRTNIYGSLLTSAATWNVIIEPDFLNPDNNMEYPDYTIANATQLAAALAAGGTYQVTENVGNIDLYDYTATQPLQLVLLSAVDGIILPNGDHQQVTIMVGKDVPYPTFKSKYTSGAHTLKNFTLTGDPTTTAKCQGLNLQAVPAVGTHAPATAIRYIGEVENVTFAGIAFEHGGLALRPVGANSATNVTVRNCVFTEQDGSTIAGNLSSGSPITLIPGAGGHINGATITGNTMAFVQNPGYNLNGIYVTPSSGNIVIKNNTITDVPYHGIQVSGAGIVEIANNNVANAGADGIKVQGADVVNNPSVNADCTITKLSINGNTLSAGENGIRICRVAFSNTPELTILGNSISYNSTGKTYSEADGEPAGILINNQYGTATQMALLNIAGNKKVGNGDHWFVMKNFELAPGSNVSAPF